MKYEKLKWSCFSATVRFAQSYRTHFLLTALYFENDKCELIIIIFKQIDKALKKCLFNDTLNLYNRGCKVMIFHYF